MNLFAEFQTISGSHGTTKRDDLIECLMPSQLMNDKRAKGEVSAW
jgi:hypothetical protein